MVKCSRPVLAGAALLFFSCLAGAQQPEPTRITFTVESQPLPDALNAWAQQAGLQIIWPADGQAAQLIAPRLNGAFTAESALQQLLMGSGLTYVFVDSHTVAIRVEHATSSSMVAVQRISTASDSQPASRSQESSTRSKAANAQRLMHEEDDGTLPEVLVEGARILNMDIRRTKDDVQPYVVFDREQIARSGATNLDTFFKNRLTMNTVGLSPSQGGTNASGSMSAINLRGLGTNQTLILVDGRRVAGSAATGTSINQPDLNGIPLAAIERIEVLPATASGIYGGAATGGVINIVLRRDYSGAAFEATYDDTFEGGSALRRFDASTGFSLAGGKTNIALAGSYAEQDPLAVRERDLFQQGRRKILINNPNFFAQSANPPLGDTPNFRSVNGSPLFGPGTPYFASVPAGYTGGGGIGALQTNAGRYNFDVANSTQSSGGGDAALLNGPTIKSGVLTLRQSLGSTVEAFIEGATATNIGHSPATNAGGTFTLPATAPTNPFGQDVRVTVPISQSSGMLVANNRSERAAGGLIVKLPADWRAEADYTWNRSRNSSSIPSNTAAAAVTAINNGTLDILRDPSSASVDFGPYIIGPIVNGPFKSTLNSATLRAAGSLASLPAGRIRLSALVEHRAEKLADGFQVVPPTITVFIPHRSQSTDSASLEATVPLVSRANKIRGIDELELQLAGRWDDYSVEGATGSIANPTPSSIVDRRTNKNHSVNPTAGLRYQPVQDVALRASYSTGFLPPGVNQLVPSVTFTPATVIDPRRGGASTALPAGQITTGGNQRLAPEDSKSWSAGFILTPRFLDGLRLSVDYVSIEKSDEIRANFTFQDFINNEAIFPGRVVRGPAAGDPFGVGQIISVDASAVNVAKSRIEAYDMALDYQIETGSTGALSFFTLATWQPHYTTQLLATSRKIENAGVTSANPLKFRANAGVNWGFQDWNLGWTARYFHSYLVADPGTAAGQITILNQGSKRVSSQIYHDIAGSYRFASEDESRRIANLLDGVEIQLGIKNVFGKAPPFDAGNTNAFYSYYADPRLQSYYISLKKQF